MKLQRAAPTLLPLLLLPLLWISCGPGLRIIEPSYIAQLSSFTLAQEIAVPATYRMGQIQIRDEVAYINSNLASGEVYFHTLTVPTAETASYLAVSATTGVGSWGGPIQFYGNLMYHIGWCCRFHSWDISDPSAIVVSHTDATNTPFANSAMGFKILGTNAYVVSAQNVLQSNLQVLSLTNPTNPETVVGSVLLPVNSGQMNLVLSSTRAYVKSRALDKLYTVDISDPAAPTHLSSVNTGSQIPGDLDQSADIAISGNYVYVAEYGANQVEVFSITDPDQPTLVQTLATSGKPMNLAIDSDTLFVVTHNADELLAYNITDPTNISLLSSIATVDQPSGLGIVPGETAVVSSFTEPRIHIFKLNYQYVEVEQ